MAGIVLENGDVISDESALQRFLEGCGFDCYAHQKIDLWKILSGSINEISPTVSALEAEVSDLEDDVFERDAEIDDLRADLEQMREERDRLAKTLAVAKEAAEGLTKVLEADAQ